MAQQIKIGEFTFESTATSKTIPVTDETFAILTLIKRLVDALERLPK